MNPKRLSRAQKIVTLAQVARKAGVSTATVSLALRQSGRISSATARRVIEAAKALGYVPDPTLRKLMVHLRTRRIVPFQSTICALFLRDGMSAYESRLLRAAQARSEALGYKLVVEPLPTSPEAGARHQKSLFYRNVEGLLLLPCCLPLDVSDLYSWDRFSVVCTGYGPMAPTFDRVTPNWYASVTLCLSALRKRGFGRVGSVFGAHYDYMMGHLPSAAVANSFILTQSDPVQPFLYLPAIREPLTCRLAAPFRELMRDNKCGPYREQLHSLPDGLVAWFDRERPDAIVSDNIETMSAVCETLGSRMPQPQARAVVSLTGFSPIAGVVQKVELIGEAALDMLHRKISHGVRGAPASPSLLTFSGELRDSFGNSGP